MNKVLKSDNEKLRDLHANFSISIQHATETWKNLNKLRER